MKNICHKYDSQYYLNQVHTKQITNYNRGMEIYFQRIFNDIENIKWIMTFIFIFQQPFYAEQDERNFIKC